jgi:hypothetical protein
MKPQNLTEVRIPTVNIGIALISKLEIDLTHVNYGLDTETKKYKNKARSNFSELEIANIFCSLDGFVMNPSGKKDDYLYFAYEIEYQRKSYMIAFCIGKNSRQTAGIITLYATQNKD